MKRLQSLKEEEERILIIRVNTASLGKLKQQKTDIVSATHECFSKPGRIITWGNDPAPTLYAYVIMIVFTLGMIAQDRR